MLYHVRQKGTTKFAVKVMLIVAIVLIAIFLVGCGSIGSIFGSSTPPGPDELATVKDKLLVGSCSNREFQPVTGCESEISPTLDNGSEKVYHIQRDTRYTWELCVYHTQSAERIFVLYWEQVPDSIPGSDWEMVTGGEHHEGGDTSSPSCKSFSFSFSKEGNRTAYYRLQETGSSLSSPNVTKRTVTFSVS